MSSEETQKSSLLQQLEPHGQSHLLRFWDDLDSDQRQRLAEQIESFDFGLIRSLASGHSEADHWEQLAEPIQALGCSLHCIKLQETENNYVEYFGQ